MPEMMRYVRMREQEKMECAFAMLWCLLILLICPMVLVLQAGMPLVYTLWTRGRFPYDPLLLSFISSSILIYAIGLPAMAVCVGNNLVKAQLRIAIFASSCLFGSLWFLVHFFGLRGAALALVTGELVSLGLYVRHAANWLRSVHLRWPRRAFLTAVFAVGATQIGASLIAVLPMIALPMCIGFIAVNLACFIIVWQSLPDSMAQEMKAKILLRVGLLRHWHSGIQ
jgi:O-antigen/teichoic acid export membrane protein